MIKILKTMLNIFYVIIIILLIGYFALRVTDKVEIYVVKTGSMEEKIHIGDYILIFRKNSYNVGDVVTYTSNDGFITHRIVKKDGSKITTKGDANNAEDNEIVESNIVGKVIMSGGILNIIINYKYIIICLLLSLYLFSCYFGKDDKKKSEKELNDEINETEEITESVSDEQVDETNDFKDETDNKLEETDINENTIIKEKNEEVREIAKKKPKKKK